MGSVDGPGTDDEVGLPASVVDEVSQRTPGFFSYQQERWWAHCNDAGRFLGEIEHVDAALLASEAAGDFVRDTCDAAHLGGDTDWPWLLRTPSRKRGIAVFVFGCLHCGKLGGYVDQS